MEIRWELEKNGSVARPMPIARLHILAREAIKFAVQPHVSHYKLQVEIALQTRATNYKVQRSAICES